MDIQFLEAEPGLAEVNDQYDLVGRLNSSLDFNLKTHLESMMEKVVICNFCSRFSNLVSSFVDLNPGLSGEQFWIWNNCTVS